MMECSDKYHRTVCGSDKVCKICKKDLHANCSSCKNWPKEWKFLIKNKQLIRGAFYKNIANEHVAPHRNLWFPKGHLIGAINILTGAEYYFGIKTNEKHWVKMTWREIIKLYLFLFIRFFK